MWHISNRYKWHIYTAIINEQTWVKYWFISELCKILSTF